MSIKPNDFLVTVDELRARLNFTEQVVIVPFGCEALLDESILRILKSRYDAGALLIRTKPDFLIIEENNLYFVEAKQKTTSIEAVQLLYNKQYERMGIRVVYSFPEIVINASLIPMETILVPENYKNEFDTNLKHLFQEEGITDFRYVGHVTKGSGDPFVPIDESDLLLLTEGQST